LLILPILPILLTMKYHIIAFGCQFNKSDSEKAAGLLKQLGYLPASELNEADLVLVLACSVRQTAVDRLFGLKIKFDAIRRKRPLLTILSGCILSSDEKKLAEFFDVVLPAKDLSNLSKAIVGTYQLRNFSNIHPAYNSKFQAYVPIMTGCDNFCSYCVVPFTRGREVSRPAGEIIEECRELIEKGYKLITLIGQNVNSYKATSYKLPARNASRSVAGGQATSSLSFPELLRRIDAMPGDYWLSFATSHPKDLSDKLIKTMAESRHVMPYLHLPAQSGDDEILKKMNRHYTAGHYVDLIKRARKAMPGLAVSTDIIAGFPTETKKQFLNTAKLFEKAKFDLAFIARYSARPGTAAAKLKDDVSLLEKKKREKILTEILKKTALKKNKGLIGQTVEVLAESYKGGFAFGRTRNFKNIKFACDFDRTGELIIVEVIDAHAFGLLGRLPRILAILGTTASGKTKLAVKLAKQFNGEIISADSRQVYQGMDVGTGKDLGEYSLNPKSYKLKANSSHIMYHLIDVENPKGQYTAAQWQTAALERIKEILRRGRVPVICGGSGLYISALVEGFSFTKTRKHENTKTRANLSKLSLKQLLALLKKIDPETFAVIDKNNRRRVERALEIYYQTGKPKSQQETKQKPPYDFLLLGLTFPREVLRERIAKRLKDRLEKEGMIEEIRKLHRRGVSWKRLEEFGLEYRFVARYLQGKLSYEELYGQLNSAIADFAKRQMTWFKRDKNIIWLDKAGEAVGRAREFLKKS